MSTSTLSYQIAITKIPKVGAKIAKTLIAYSGGPEAVFSESKKSLLKIPGIGEIAAEHILSMDPEEISADAVQYIQQKGIKTSFYLNDDSYPKRLTHYEDAPILLYHRGTEPLNAPRTVSIVGTRQPTPYGIQKTQEIVEGLKDFGVQIISGMAHGVDGYAHKASLANDIPTLAIMGTPLDMVYPAAHRQLSERIAAAGALVSEFALFGRADRENFPMRNRIIAAMSDVVIVIQSAAKGGSLITADFANGYHKDVFALPGRTTDQMSEGCNKLIKANKAHLLESVADIAYIMRWDQEESKPKQTSLFVELEPAEKEIYELLQKQEAMSIDQLHYETKKPLSELSSLLLTMEFKGMICSLPGKNYSLI